MSDNFTRDPLTNGFDAGGAEYRFRGAGGGRSFPARGGSSLESTDGQDFSCTAALLLPVKVVLVSGARLEFVPVREEWRERSHSILLAVGLW